MSSQTVAQRLDNSRQDMVGEKLSATDYVSRSRNLLAPPSSGGSDDIVLTFADGSGIHLSIRPNDDRGPEPVIFHALAGRWWVV
jgi:hypothetical protein